MTSCPSESSELPSLHSEKTSMEEQPKPAEPTPPPTQIPDPNPNPNPNPPNTEQNLPPLHSEKTSMEEQPKPAETTPPPTQIPNSNPNPNPNPNPPNTAQNLPPQAPETKKRVLDQNDRIQNSKYFKMRAVLKDIRPHFIEVLRTPDFQNCKAAHEIREQMKLLMDLYKEMTTETISITKCKNVQEGPFSSEIQDVKPVEQPPFVKPSEVKPVLLGTLSEKQRSEDGRTHGTYIIGGSAFGWNFITFPGNKAVYYGRTKEMFRSANVVPQ